MDDNNKNPGSHSTPPSPAPTTQPEETSHLAIKRECKRALTCLRLGNHAEALKLIDEAYHHHQNCALFHRCKATIGIESARRASSLSPNSLEFAYFYANQLYEAAQDQKDYEEVIQECERALAVPNPADPETESFAEQTNIFAAERWIYVKEDLSSLIQKANIASITIWMRDFCKRENFQLIPIRSETESIDLRPIP